MISLVFLFLCAFARSLSALQDPTPSLAPSRKICVVQSSRNATDDAPAIIDAFNQCGQGGKVVFLNQTYHVNSVMNTTGLKDCDVDLNGTLLWGTDISYWLNHSLSIGYQNQSSAWFFGGEGITFRGYGVGTLDGNGQVWYDFVNGISNYPRRPHAITIWGTRNSVFEGLRFVQSQMWTMTVIHSSSVLLQNIHVNSTSHSHAPARNTDGADTIFADNITFRGWTIDNGDDSIAMKANSTNILIEDCTFYRGLGVAIGSIGQYAGVFETVENVTARDLTCYGTRHAGYIKTWTGQQVGYPPNGGGGGLGYARNITLTNITLQAVTSPALAISQCTTFSGTAGDCNSSLFQLQNLDWGGLHGTTITSTVASLQCSRAAPCRDVEIRNVDLKLTGNGTSAVGYLCSGVEGTRGFNCTGTACVGGSAAGGC